MFGLWAFLHKKEITQPNISFHFDITKREEDDGNGGEPGPKGRRRGWLLLTAAATTEAPT